MNELNLYAPWVAITLSFIAVLYPILSGKARKTDERFEALDEKLGSKASETRVALLAGKVDIVEDKVTVIESDLKHLPDKETTHRLEVALGEVKTEMGRLTERMKPIANMADRMQEALIEKVMS